MVWLKLIDFAIIDWIMGLIFSQRKKNYGVSKGFFGNTGAREKRLSEMKTQYY